MPSTPLLLAVDGNSLLHRAHHAWAGSLETDRYERPIWGLLGLMVAIGAAAARCEPDALVVGFDCGERSVRRESYAAYKAHRPDKPVELQAQLDAAPSLLAGAGVPVVQVNGYEADDVLASAAAVARREGWRAVLVTSDRDAFALLDETTSMLRVVNGGIDDSPLLTPADLIRLYQVGPARYRDLAVLRGDPSDNLRGVPGVGSRSAARLLARFDSLDAVFAALDSGDEAAGADVAATVGEPAAGFLASPAGREQLRLTHTLMTMHDDLPLPPSAELRLPLDGVRLRTTLRERDIRLGRSLWALVGEPRPAWTPNGFDKAPAALPRVEAPPWALSRWFTAQPSPGPAPSGPPGAARARPTRSTPPRRGPAAAVPQGQLSLF